jgi:hypothetical protein
MGKGWAYGAIAALLLGMSQALAATPVPAGNINAEQPAIPGASSNRTRAGRTTFEAKYRKVLRLLETDQALRGKIRQAASDYGIDPLHIAGAIVGEHTYNVDAYDRLQSYYVKAVAYLKSNLNFSYDGEAIGDFIDRPEFAQCDSLSGSYDQWTCREDVWNVTFRGRTVGGKSFPDNRFSAVFFQPYYAGQTFGIGQLNPLTALMVSDYVHRVSGRPKLDADHAQEVYRTIMDPDVTLDYVAATLRMSIDAYRDIAGFDISGNPGITATLYNLGNPRERAAALAAENRRREAAGEPQKLPEENYYGWLVNDRIADLQALFQ